VNRVHSKRRADAFAHVSARSDATRVLVSPASVLTTQNLYPQVRKSRKLEMLEVVHSGFIERFMTAHDLARLPLSAVIARARTLTRREVPTSMKTSWIASAMAAPFCFFSWGYRTSLNGGQRIQAIRFLSPGPVDWDFWIDDVTLAQ